MLWLSIFLPATLILLPQNWWQLIHFNTHLWFLFLLRILFRFCSERQLIKLNFKLLYLLIAYYFFRRWVSLENVWLRILNNYLLLGLTKLWAYLFFIRGIKTGKFKDLCCCVTLGLHIYSMIACQILSFLLKLSSITTMTSLSLLRVWTILLSRFLRTLI